MRAALRRAASAPARLRPRDLWVLLPALLVGAVLSALGTGALFGATRPVAWLVDESRGEVVHFDARGMAGPRLQIGDAGQRLEVVQDGAHVVVVNHTTGEATSIDLDSLQASGHHQCTSNDGLRVLVHDGAWYVADRVAGTVSRVDPATLQTSGRVWVGDGPLADATVDGTGAVWALSSAGVATALTWAETGPAGLDGSAGRNASAGLWSAGIGSSGGRFAVTTTQAIDGIVDSARLVAHEVGATVVSAATGTFAQVGTPTPYLRRSAPLTGPVELPARSPSTLVPVTNGESVLLLGSLATSAASVGAMRCPAPGAAAVFEGVVYVPCHSGRVLRLGPQGTQVADDIVATDAETLPTLVLGGDRVYITVAGAPAGVQVLRDGRTLSFDGGSPRQNGRPNGDRRPADTGKPSTRPGQGSGQPDRGHPTQSNNGVGQGNRPVTPPSHGNAPADTAGSLPPGSPAAKAPGRPNSN